MPLYEYECDACGRRFEVIQKFSETTTECRHCGKGPVKRLMAAPAFQFKGTGWYITDYAQKGKTGGDSPGPDAGGGKADKPKSDAAGGDGAKKSETPAAAPAAAAKD